MAKKNPSPKMPPKKAPKPVKKGGKPKVII